MTRPLPAADGPASAVSGACAGACIAHRQTARQGEAAGLGNSRLVFALCCAFAGPMLRLAGMESGGFHLRGNSSQGKTTALKVAASVWGRRN